ncbi:MAG: GAF domain-containing protein [Planctomycetaceae bacterium]|jgi:hypothetical protein|nr:GAF domain-containing protein [Planctomycetaceae bacterium]
MLSDFYDKHLRPFPVEQEIALSEETPYFGAFPELSRVFRKVTGYHLSLLPNDEFQDEYCAIFPVSAGCGECECCVGLQRSLTSTSLIPEKDVTALAKSVADLLGETYSWQHELQVREAELASHIQLTFHLQKDYGLSERLTRILKTGAELIQCCAASLYLLDHETSYLKLRSCWGISPERLLAPPRPLNTSLSDLEAMLGHAVILNEEFLYEKWNTPEAFETSVCVPISSTTTIHGTLWFFAANKRSFSDTELGLMEIVAGRIAVELERTALLREGHDAMILKRQLTDAEHSLQALFPQASLKENGWQFAGSISHTRPLAAASYNWYSLSDHVTLVSLISTAEKTPSVEAQIRCSLLQTEIGYLARYVKSPKRIAEEIQDIAFAEKAKNNTLAMMFFLVDHQKEVVRLMRAGHFILFHIAKTNEIRSLDKTTFTNGFELNEMQRFHLFSGESLITIHTGQDSMAFREEMVKSILTRFTARNPLQKHFNALMIAETFTAFLQDMFSGENITIVAIRNAGSAG